MKKIFFILATLSLIIGAVFADDIDDVNHPNYAVDEDSIQNYLPLGKNTEVNFNCDQGCEIQITENPSHTNRFEAADGSQQDKNLLRVRYEPFYDYNGEDIFQYKICQSQQDNAGGEEEGGGPPAECTNPQDINMTINPVNDIPEIGGVTIPVIVSVKKDYDGDGELEDGRGQLNATNEYSGDGWEGEITISEEPEYGKFEFYSREQANGCNNRDEEKCMNVSFIYTADDVIGEFKGKYKFCDKDNDCSEGNLFANVVPISGEAPKPVDDTLEIEKNSGGHVLDVLANDNFGEDGPSTTRAMTIPDGHNAAHGSVVIDDNGTPNNPSDDKVVYKPMIDFIGTDEFDYKICDTDGDCAVGTVMVNVKDSDADGDGVSDAEELADGTNPNDPNSYKDTDFDSVPDAVEKVDGTNPINPTDYKDTDADGTPDYLEKRQGTDLNDKNSYKDDDGNHVPDYVAEWMNDKDGDGVSDRMELAQGTDPDNARSWNDTDNDGYPDQYEMKRDSDPYDKENIPDGQTALYIAGWPKPITVYQGEKTNLNLSKDLAYFSFNDPNTHFDGITRNDIPDFLANPKNGNLGNTWVEGNKDVFIEYTSNPDFIGDDEFDFFMLYTNKDGVQFKKVLKQKIIVIKKEAPKGRSGKKSSGAKHSLSSKKVCKDTRAINFSNVGQHDQRLCKYQNTSLDLVKNNLKTKEEKKEKVEDKKDEKEITCSELRLTPCPIFTQHMKLGDYDGKISDVKQERGVSNLIKEVALLQKHLKKQGFYNGIIDGYYSPAVFNAVARWQEKYRKDVLEPWGVKKPTGFFYKSSERYMNIILGCNDEVKLDTGKFLAKIKELKTLNYVKKCQADILNKEEKVEEKNEINDELVVKIEEEEKVEKQSCPKFTTYYRKGEKGGEISEIQSFLKGQGFNPGRIDGVMGDRTISAIKAFQSKYFDDILKPWGLKKATGRWYQSTRFKANDLSGCHESVKLDNGKILK